MIVIDAILCGIIGVLWLIASSLMIYIYVTKESKFALITGIIFQNLGFLFLSAIFFMLFFEVRITVSLIG